MASRSKLLVFNSRGRNVVAGSPRSSLPSATLIAISQQVAMLTNFRFAGFSINVRAVLLSLESLFDEPEEGVCIQQQVHSMYSRKSSKGSSKSGAILTLPAGCPPCMARKRVQPFSHVPGVGLG